MFHSALEHVFREEGGFVNHPQDPGGATNFGITHKVLQAHRQAAVTIDAVRDLTREEASAIYHQNYWLAGRCDKLPSRLAFMHFDACVNHGIGQAAKFLQRSAGVTADGSIGPRTLAATRSTNERDALIDYATQRMVFYARLKTFDSFGRGWSRRLMRTFAHCLETK